VWTSLGEDPPICVYLEKRNTNVGEPPYRIEADAPSMAEDDNAVQVAIDP
jgi:hypothetical protein